MPIYEFICERCNKITEKQCPITSDIKIVPCSYCSEKANEETPNEWTFVPSATRIISRNTFHLKGGGWGATSRRENTSAGSEDGDKKVNYNSPEFL